jgi:SM-20-related protein
MSKKLETSEIEALEKRGYVVLPAFLSPNEAAEQRSEIARLKTEGSFRPARVGRADQTQRHAQVRGDETCWLEPSRLTPPQAPLWNAMESLRTTLNEKLFLGLFELEAHYALYAPGSFYERHLDRFQNTDLRVLSVVLYLNESWSPEDGGQLRLEIPETKKTIDVQPEAGTLVLFLSDRFPHEVRPTRRERMSFTGWFKRRS